MDFRILGVLFVTAALVLCSVDKSTAAPVDYNESVSGDINGLPFMLLDFGTNKVTGTSHYIWNGSVSDADHDGFPFFVPQGGVLKNVSFSFTASPPLPNTIVLFAKYWLMDNDFPPSLLDTTPRIEFLTDASPIEFFDSVLPLTAGWYRIMYGEVGAGGPSLAATFGGSWDYTFTFEVARIPEPGTITLLATGLALIAAAGRRRARA